MAKRILATDKKIASAEGIAREKSYYNPIAFRQYDHSTGTNPGYLSVF